MAEDARIEELRPYLEDAAAKVARHYSSLSAMPHAVRVLLTPGDATVYHITIDRTPWIFVKPDGTVREHLPAESWTVTLMGFGDTYWWPRMELHWDYVASKWCRGNEYTARLLTVFLNALNKEMPL